MAQLVTGLVLSAKPDNKRVRLGQFLGNALKIRTIGLRRGLEQPRLQWRGGSQPAINGETLAGGKAAVIARQPDSGGGDIGGVPETSRGMAFQGIFPGAAGIGGQRKGGIHHAGFDPAGADRIAADIGAVIDGD